MRPCTVAACVLSDVGRAIERDEFLAAVARIPFERERELLTMIELEGRTQTAVAEHFGIGQATASRSLKSALQILGQLLPLGSALDPERITGTLAKLSDDKEREVLRLLYCESGEATRAAKALGISEVQLRRLHQRALGKLSEGVGAGVLQGRG